MVCRGDAHVASGAISDRAIAEEAPAMQTDLRPEDLGDLLEQPLIGVLATRRADDTILLSRRSGGSGATAASTCGPRPRTAARSATSGATPG